jgi:hypothetical protein
MNVSIGPTILNKQNCVTHQNRYAELVFPNLFNYYIRREQKYKIECLCEGYICDKSLMMFLNTSIFIVLL